jgi:hypothetical protein
MKNKETLEEAAKKHLNSGIIPNDYQSFIKGAKSDAARDYWFEKFQQEQDKKMYSEVDLEVAYFEGREGLYSFNDWIKQFKTK